MKRDSNNWDILARELSGESLPDEELQFKEWNEDPENHQLFEIIENIKLDFNNEVGIQAKDQVFKKTFNKIFSSRTQKTNRFSGRRYLLSIAAGIALLACLASAFLLYKNFRMESPLVVLSCPSGISTILLPDGSSVTLNSGSTLKYPANFDKDSRRISLEGEAFFDVKKDKKRPFIVTTSAMDFRVLGTTFNISAYPHDEEITASLLTGSIELSDNINHRSLVLQPNEGVTFNTKTANMELRTIEPEYITGWTKGELLFKKNPFTSVCCMLERKFGCKIEIKKPELENKIFNGKFKNNETLSEILEIIRINEPFSYTIQGNQVCIF